MTTKRDGKSTAPGATPPTVEDLQARVAAVTQERDSLANKKALPGQTAGNTRASTLTAQMHQRKDTMGAAEVARVQRLLAPGLDKATANATMLRTLLAAPEVQAFFAAWPTVPTKVLEDGGCPAGLLHSFLCWHGQALGLHTLVEQHAKVADTIATLTPQDVARTTVQAVNGQESFVIQHLQELLTQAVPLWLAKDILGKALTSGKEVEAWFAEHPATPSPGYPPHVSGGPSADRAEMAFDPFKE